MKCPYCQKEMTEGFIPNGGNVDWYEKDDDALPLMGGMPLSPTPVFKFTKIEAWHCADCHMVIVPVKEEFEGPVDRFTNTVKEKFTGLTARITDAMDERQEQREDEKRQKQRDEHRKKDPWEV